MMGKNPRNLICNCFPFPPMVIRVCSAVFGFLDLVFMIALIILAVCMRAGYYDISGGLIEINQTVIVVGAFCLVLVAVALILMFIGIENGSALFVLPQLFLQAGKILGLISFVLYSTLHKLLNTELMDKYRNQICLAIVLCFGYAILQLFVYVHLIRYLSKKKEEETSAEPAGIQLNNRTPEVMTVVSFSNLNYNKPFSSEVASSVFAITSTDTLVAALKHMLDEPGVDGNDDMQKSLLHENC